MKGISFLRRFSKAIQADDRKTTARMMREYIWFKLTKPSVAEQYFIKYLFRTDSGDYRDYLNTHRHNQVFWNIYDPSFAPIMDKKDLFEVYFTHCGINVARSLLHNDGVVFYNKEQMELITTPEDFVKYLQSLNIKRSLFIKKKQDSFGGRNIFKARIEDLNDTAYLGQIYREVIRSGYIFQNEIIQHREMNRLNPYCVNSLRIVVYTNKSQKENLMSASLRTALRKIYVDNVSNGGGSIPVDMEEGVLTGNIYTDFEKGRGKVWKRHPVTNMEIKGFKIPYYKEARKLALEASSALPQISLIGWDIAITPEGPLIIEGNKSPDLNFQEVAQKGFRRNPVYASLMKDHLAGANFTSK